MSVYIPEPMFVPDEPTLYRFSAAEMYSQRTPSVVSGLTDIVLQWKMSAGPAGAVLFQLQTSAADIGTQSTMLSIPIRSSLAPELAASSKQMGPGRFVSTIPEGVSISSDVALHLRHWFGEGTRIEVDMDSFGTTPITCVEKGITPGDFTTFGTSNR